jgi:hypothetical protein
MTAIEVLLDGRNWSLFATDNGHKVEYKGAEWVGDTIPWKEASAEYAALIAELETKQKSVESARETLEAIKNRIDYLQNLWGREGVTDNVIDIISMWLTAHLPQEEEHK